MSERGWGKEEWWKEGWGWSAQGEGRCTEQQSLDILHEGLMPSDFICNMKEGWVGGVGGSGVLPYVFISVTRQVSVETCILFIYLTFHVFSFVTAEFEQRCAFGSVLTGI